MTTNIDELRKSFKSAEQVDDTVALVSSKISSIASVLAPAMMDRYSLSVRGKFKVGRSFRMPITDDFEAGSDIADRIVRDWDGLFAIAAESVVGRLVPWSDLAVALSVDKGITFSAVIGQVQSIIRNAGSISRAQRKKGVEERKIVPSANKMLTFIFKAVVRRFTRQALTVEKFMDGIDSSILSFANKVSNSLTASVRSNFELAEKDAAAMVEEVLDVDSLYKVVSIMIQGQMEAILPDLLTTFEEGDVVEDSDSD